jgi:phosphoglycerate-specific signal transduction histidine kinase
MERIEPFDDERPSCTMQRIEPIDDERRQRIDDVIRDVEEVSMELDESTSRSIKALIGELRQLVNNLSDVGPGLSLFEDMFII